MKKPLLYIAAGLTLGTVAATTLVAPLLAQEQSDQHSGRHHTCCPFAGSGTI